MSKIEAQLRQELAQLTQALEETDEALDEWIAETERLQLALQAKDKDTKLLLEQMDELRVHSLKLMEDYHAQQEELKRIRSSPSSASPPKPSAKPIPAVAPANRELEQELANKNAQLSAQLVQSQNWVAEGLKKLEQAQHEIKLEQEKFTTLEREYRGLVEGKKLQLESERDLALWHVGRLGNVQHALELELTQRRQACIELKRDLLEAEANAGKWQALYAVHRFQAETNSTNNLLVINWLKSVARWSAKL